MVTFTHWKKIAIDGWSTDSVSFTACQIKVTSMFVKDNRLTFRGAFTCSNKQPASKATGSFAVKAIKLGISKVD